jgi:hypothetical protein
MIEKLSSIFKGVNGGYEVNRFIGAVGGIVYIVGAHVFVAWDMAKGHAFDLVAYCLAFPGGLAAVVGGTAGAVALKDSYVARAKTETAAAAVVQADADGRS